MSAKVNSRFRNKIKETKWEIIRKKHINCINVTTETVQKFLKMEFVDEEKLHRDGIRKINPVVVMNLRHEMIRNRPKTTLTRVNTAPASITKPIDKDSETQLIDKELQKFKHEMKKIIHIPNIKPKKKKKSILITLNNTGIFKSLTDCEEKTKDFFQTAISSTQQISTKPNLNPNEEKPQKSETVKQNSVKFGDDVEVITYSKETSSATESDFDTEDILHHFNNETFPYDSKNFQEQNKTFVTFCEQSFTYQNTKYFCQDKDSDSYNTSLTIDDTESSTLSTDIDFFSKTLNMDTEEIDLKREESQEYSLLSNLIIKPLEEKPKKDSLPEDFTDNELNMMKDILKVHKRNSDQYYQKLLRKYLLKWIHYTTIQKITKDSNLTTKSQRMTKIDAYLNRIRTEKKLAKQNKSNAEKVATVNQKENAIIMVKKYQSKMKIQQDIIDLQKIKLERQERMIAELRLSKLSEEAKQFKNDLKEELNKAIKTGDVRLRAKAKCLQMVGNIKIEEEEDKLTAYGNVIPRFLAKMQERALERQMKHEQAKERRLRLEQEKEMVKQSIEDDKRMADEEAKRLRILELKEKRRQEKLLKQQKEQDRLKWIENNRKSNEFYRTYLLRRFGMDRFKKLLNRKRIIEFKSNQLRKRVKMKTCFKSWFSFTREIWRIKYEKADNYYRIYVLRICVRFWKENMLLERGKLLVAMDWNEMKLNERYFANWKAFTQKVKILDENKMKHAKSHYNWHLKWKVIEHWQRLHAILKLERETEERRQRWRHKIWELLPDYTPNLDN